MEDKEVFDRALELAAAFSDHCKMHDLPKSTILDGVAFDAESVKRVSYDRGKHDERMRIKHLIDGDS